VSEEPFVLERTENPHPVMLRGAWEARRDGPVAFWLGYLAAMCDATGESETEIIAWMERMGDR
jgi:hypothetical protein